jgi:hypothetical protein
MFLHQWFFFQTLTLYQCIWPHQHDFSPLSYGSQQHHCKSLSRIFFHPSDLLLVHYVVQPAICSFCSRAELELFLVVSRFPVVSYYAIPHRGYPLNLVASVRWAVLAMRLETANTINTPKQHFQNTIIH